MHSPRLVVLLLLAGLCSLLSQGFLIPTSRCPPQRALAKPGGLLPLPLALPLLLRAAADGGVGAEVGAVESCRRKIQEALTPVQLVVKSSNDDPNGSHVALRVVSASFEGKNRVQRQQMVYKAIWEELAGPIHAVDELVCRTPAEEGM